MLRIADILDKLKAQNRDAQKELYKYLAPKLMATSMRYVGNRYDAEDYVQEAFIKIFTKIEEFRNDCPIEFWAKRILVNFILQEFRKAKKQFVDIDGKEDMVVSELDASVVMQHQDIVKLVGMLPEGKKLVFNLYIIEGYSHKEIAEQLGITESTSKTQLFKAKEILVNLHKRYNESYARSIS